MPEQLPADDSPTVVLTRPRYRRPWVRRTRRLLVIALTAFVVVTGWSVAGALTRPGSDSTAARLAEWGRDHGLGSVITFLEAQQYQHHQPRIGGRPSVPIPAAGPGASTGPPPLAVLAGGARLPGEGVWRTAATDRHGRPAVRVTELRPDARHTSYLAGVLWLDPKLVRGELRPGAVDPGGSWRAAAALTPAEQGGVAAAFNAGFRLTHDDSHGGYYSEGRTAVPLVDGAASLVLHTNGTATVGSWNREVRMSPDVASVRQNLVPLVDNGVVDPSCATGGQAQWGNTIGQAAYIDRSGFGVTATGAEIYVGGPALSVCSLARILRAAGVVRGMELDINPDWITGVYFHDHPGGPPTGYRLYPGQKPGPLHYLTTSSRDWYAWFLRD